MIEVKEDGRTRTVPTKSRGYSSPKDEGVRFSVAPAELKGWYAVVACFWRFGSRIGQPQIVDRFPSEREAELAARAMAMKQDEDES